MTFLTVSNISKQGLGNFKLENISFSMRKNQKVALSGETGSGKSTLLKIIAGLEQPDGGEVLFKDERVKGSEETLVAGHPAIVYLSQDFELPKFLHVDQILSYSNKLSKEDADALFEVCQISHLMQRKTNELSGGEKQRIALAKLLVSSPQLLLLDEPFSNLDMVHKNTLKQVLNSICEELKISCILVSHDPLDTLSWADKIIVMRDGKILQKGSSKKIYNRPMNEYIAGLFGNFTVLTQLQAFDFYNTWAIKPKKKKLMVRPENIKISNKKKKGIPGKVRKVKFFGSHYQVEISFQDRTILASVKKNDLRKGDEVYLTCSSEDVWYI